MIDARRLAGPLAAIAAIVTVLSSQPAAALGADDVRSRIAAEYGVTVLKVKPGKYEGAAVYFVTVMNPGGAFNGAFQVNTLVIDAATGKTLPVFRQMPSGQQMNEAPSFEPNRQPADTFRQGRAWR